MLAFKVGDLLSSFLLKVLPNRLSNRIKENTSDVEVFVLRSSKMKTKPRMTLIEGVFATILFDLALFGTSNPLIKLIVALFTNLQNSWDEPFSSKHIARKQIQEFCDRLTIQSEPWIWEKNIEDYHSLNDFFSRTYQPKYFPSLGKANIVSPACCTLTRYRNNDELKSILIKGCEYRIQDIGLPMEDENAYSLNDIFLGYLSPTDYHRVHSPISGKCIHCSLEGADKRSASVKFFGGKFNIMNENKRLVIVLESTEITAEDCRYEDPLRVTLVVVGGIGVDTIVYDPAIKGKFIKKGEELSLFQAGGSAIAILSTKSLQLEEKYANASTESKPVEVLVGESLANIR
jgi:phosphatidylserine decarboxylase